jgi:hypothetical protein
MARPLVLIHGYSAEGKDFYPLCKALLKKKNINSIDVNICSYISLNNEITIKDIAEGLDRAFRTNNALNAGQPFDAIVHSTGMLVIRSWLTNYGADVASNKRLHRLKHLIGLAPATWGSPQAHKGRTWLGALVKGNRDLGPDFLNAGDQVLAGLELGSDFTWELAHADLLGPEPYYDKGPTTPYVCIFIGNTPYTGLSSVANDPGTDGTVRWSGCGLNTRKIRVDLTRTPIGEDGRPTSRVTISPWAENRLDIPMIAVDGRNHGSLVGDPEDGMVKLVADFLDVGDPGGPSYEDWLKSAKAYSAVGEKKMLTHAGVGADLPPEVKALIGHLVGEQDQELEGWQQFVVHAIDERGDGVSDYMLEVIRNGEPFDQMYTDVHAYGNDASFRCFHIRLPKGLVDENSLAVRVHASTGTELVAYQGYGDKAQELTATSAPVEIALNLGHGEGSLFYPFTTTLVEIVLNREPLPFNAESRLLGITSYPAG